MGKLGWLTIALVGSVAGSATSAQKPRPRPKTVNTAMKSLKDADRAWSRHRKRLGRVKGSIAIDPAVQRAVLGSCHDIVVQAISAEWKTVASVQAFGNLRDGECSYSALLPAQRGMHLRGFYGGPSGRHPGDFLQLSAKADGGLDVEVGATSQLALKLTYDYVR